MGLDISLFGAFTAGLLSFLTPCILPMVPFYLSYMAGLSVKELQDEGGIAPGAKRRMVVAAVFFALGVTTIFVLLGLGASMVGGFLIQYKHILSYVAGGILIIFGLHFLGILKIALLYREARIETSASPATIGGAYVMGLAFGFGWTPCAGPALASVLAIAASKGVSEGGMLLAFYGIGMTGPFVLAALFAGPFLNFLARHRSIVQVVEKIMGVLLIVFGVLIATNLVGMIAQWMIELFPGFVNII